MEYAGIAITLLGIFFAAATAWGQITTRVEDNRKEMERRCIEFQKELTNMDDKQKQCVGREHCSLKHEYLTTTLNEMKEQLKTIQRLLQELSEK